jgi:SAM-dependent methyltransferase
MDLGYAPRDTYAVVRSACRPVLLWWWARRSGIGAPDAAEAVHQAKSGLGVARKLSAHFAKLGLPRTRADLHSGHDRTAARVVSEGGGIQAVIEATELCTLDNAARLIDPVNPHASLRQRPARACAAVAVCNAAAASTATARSRRAAVSAPRGRSTLAGARLRLRGRAHHARPLFRPPGTLSKANEQATEKRERARLARAARPSDRVALEMGRIANEATVVFPPEGGQHLPAKVPRGSDSAIVSVVIDERDWAAEFDGVYAAPASAVAERVWREVFGDEYPEGVDPNSYVRVSELGRFAEELRVGEGDLLLDAACGGGGPGLWVAARTGTDLVGFDISVTALEAARARAAAVGLAGRTEYRVGSFRDTSLEDGIADAVMSVDALLFAPDKTVALEELHRVLRPDGRLVFTSWDYHRQPEGRPPQVDDHRPLLRANGFDVLAYDETRDWLAVQTQTTDALLDSVDELAAESNADPVKLRASLEEMRTTMDSMSRRVFVVAQRA